MKSNEQIGAEAARIARKKILEQCRSVKLSSRKVLQRISDALNACETKAHFDKDRGKWFYSEPMIDWGARAKAVDQGIMVLDMKPPEKLEITDTRPMVMVNDAAKAERSAKAD